MHLQIALLFLKVDLRLLPAPSDPIRLLSSPLWSSSFPPAWQLHIHRHLFSMSSILLCTGSNHLLLYLLPAPCWSIAPVVVVVNPRLDQSSMEISFLSIRIFDLANVLCRMPFLMQPSPFICARDRRLEYTEFCLFLYGWVLFKSCDVTSLCTSVTY